MEGIFTSLLVGVLVILLGGSLDDEAQCSHPHYDTLMALYDSKNGANWTNNSGWVDGATGESCDPCNFNGGTWAFIACVKIFKNLQRKLLD